MNDETLPESTSAEFEFDYVDITSVTTGRVSSELSRMSFGEAPSRARRLARSGDVIISTVRTYLKAIAPIAESDHPRVYSTGFAVLRPDLRLVESGFFKFALLGQPFIDQITAHSVGVSYPAINASSLMRFALAVPDLATQRRIADYLDREMAEMDAMDADLDRLIETLVERKKAGLLRLGHLVGGRNDRSPGRTTTLKHVLRKRQRPIRPTDGVVTAFRDGEVTLRSNRREDGFTVSFSEDGYQGVEAGDFVFHGLDGFSGAVGIADSRGKVSPVYHVCTASTDTFPEFMAWTLRAMAATGLLEAYAWSVRQRSVDYRNWATFGSLPVSLPTLQEQHAIVERLVRERAEIEAMIADAQRLKELLAERRTTLITEVVTGRKEVPA